jgi:hypothetical protein
MKYKQYTFGGHRIYEHRLVWMRHHGDIPDGMHIHHINHNKLDNHIENLRLVTHKENSNQNDTWGKGYTYRKDKPRHYEARKYNKHIGYYGTPAGAIIQTRMFLINGGIR